MKKTSLSIMWFIGSIIIIGILDIFKRHDIIYTDDLMVLSFFSSIFLAALMVFLHSISSERK